MIAILIFLYDYNVTIWQAGFASLGAGRAEQWATSQVISPPPKPGEDLNPKPQTKGTSESQPSNQWKI